MRKIFRHSYGCVVLHFGLNWYADLLQTIVRDLWTLRLSKLAHRLESPQRGDSESQAFSSTAEETGDDDSWKASKRVNGVDSPNLVETIGLCYLGILLLRLPVSLGDIYR
jgi:RNA polymerase I-specific transcription initiation factor RRN7